jgi:hypothetical protein
MQARRNCQRLGRNTSSREARFAFALRFQHCLCHFLDEQVMTLLFVTLLEPRSGSTSLPTDLESVPSGRATEGALPARSSVQAILRRAWRHSRQAATLILTGMCEIQSHRRALSKCQKCQFQQRQPRRRRSLGQWNGANARVSAAEHTLRRRRPFTT